MYWCKTKGMQCLETGPLSPPVPCTMHPTTTSSLSQFVTRPALLTGRAVPLPSLSYSAHSKHSQVHQQAEQAALQHSIRLHPDQSLYPTRPNAVQHLHQDQQEHQCFILANLKLYCVIIQYGYSVCHMFMLAIQVLTSPLKICLKSVHGAL